MKDLRTACSAEPTVIPLEALDRDAIERGGGKGANLGEAIAAGLHVPPGFCVTTAAYRHAVVATGLAVAIDSALHDVRLMIRPRGAGGSTHRRALPESATAGGSGRGDPDGLSDSRYAAGRGRSQRHN